MSYFKIKNNECDKCNKLSQLSFYTKSEIENLIKTGGLAPDFEKILVNLILGFNDGSSEDIITAINGLKDKIDKKQGKSAQLDYLSGKTNAEIDAIISLAKVIK